jgi:hypothetical protein
MGKIGRLILGDFSTGCGADAAPLILQFATVGWIFQQYVLLRGVLRFLFCAR